MHIPIDAFGIERYASTSIENTVFALARYELFALQTFDCFHFENVSLIKIDVEGHVFSVIKWAEQTIASLRPVLLVEIEQRYIVCPINELFEKILGLVYQEFFMTWGELSALENFEVARHQSMENCGGSKVEYINNFLFFYRDRLADEEYSGLLKGPLLK